MSVFDSNKGSLGGVIGSAAAAVLPAVIDRVFPGGLHGLLDLLSQSGFGKQVNSWLGRNENHPISTEDLRGVVSEEQIRQISEKLGIPADQALAVLSKLLPEAVDKQSPDGTLQPSPPATGQQPA